MHMSSFISQRVCIFVVALNMFVQETHAGSSLMEETAMFNCESLNLQYLFKQCCNTRLQGLPSNTIGSLPIEPLYIDI